MSDVSVTVDHHPERIYKPAADETQFSWRAVFAGCLLGSVVSAMNIYLGLRIGWSIGGSLIAAILGFAIFNTLFKAGIIKKAFGVLEVNITQTAGSAAGTMTSAAGLLAPIPAMAMLGHEFTMAQLYMWAGSVAYLGVFFAVPLRRQMVLVEKLRFPTGTATAETIMAMFSSGDEASRKAKVLLYWSVGAGAWTILSYFVPQIEHPPIEFIGLSLPAAWTFSLLLSPMMWGVGLLIGPRVGLSMLGGAVVGWLLMGGVAVDAGWANGPVMDEELGQWTSGGLMSYATGVRGWILWTGVAIMVGDALTNLALSWKTIVNTFRMPKGGEDVVDDAPDVIPNTWWMGGLAIASTATVMATYILFDIPIVLSVVAIGMSSVLAMIATRSTGETDINPIGGMGKVTQLVFGGIAPGQIATNLMAAAITGSGASQAGDMMQDLKTGHLLGASPQAQFKAQLVGIAAGVLFCVPVYMLFAQVYEIGGEDIPAPAAQAWKAVAVLLAQGVSALPPMALDAVALGLAFGIYMPVVAKLGPDKWKPYLPSGLAFGIAMIVPAYYSIAMCGGSLLLVWWRRSKPEQCAALAFAVAAGAVAGEGLMGIVKALFTLLGVPVLT